MNTRTKKIVVIVGVAGLIIAALYLLLSVLLSFVYVGFSDRLKNELDNPYIDQNYENWRPIVIEAPSDSVEFLVPDDWIFSKDPDGTIRVTDGSHRFTAIGTTFGMGDSIYSSEREFVKSIIAMLDTKTEEGGVSGTTNYIGGTRKSAYGRIGVQGVDDPYDIALYPNSAEDQYFYLIFMPGPCVETEEFMEIMQAIAYSHSYPELWEDIG